MTEDEWKSVTLRIAEYNRLNSRRAGIDRVLAVIFEIVENGNSSSLQIVRSGVTGAFDVTFTGWKSVILENLQKERDDIERQMANV